MFAYSTSVVIDATLCVALTAFFYINFYRLARTAFYLAVVVTKLFSSAACALVIHSLLQFSSVYVNTVYASSDHKFGSASTRHAQPASQHRVQGGSGNNEVRVGQRGSAAGQARSARVKAGQGMARSGWVSTRCQGGSAWVSMRSARVRNSRARRCLGHLCLGLGHASGPSGE
jgi:hypothetical protein